MPKPTKGPRLGGSSSHQKALLANLATSLFEHGRIKTTEPKARALRPYAEKLITHAKKGTLHNRREVMKKIRDKDVVHTSVRRDRPVLRGPRGRLHPHHQGGGTQGRQRPDGRHRAGAGEDRDLRGRPCPPRGCVEEGRARQGGAGCRRGCGRRGPAEETVEDVEVEDAADRGGPDGRGRGRGRGGRRPPRPRPTRPRTRPTTPSPNERTERCPPSNPMAGIVRLRLDIAYDGTEFAGWAAQTGQRTVAGVLDEALSTVFRTPVVLRAAGRTDTGVHATGQVAHCDVPRDALGHAQPRNRRDGDPSSCRWCAGSRRFLPDDVRVLDIVRAPSGFDARFSALRRHYEYRLSTAPYGVEPAAGPLRHAVAAPARRRRDG